MSEISKVMVGPFEGGALVKVTGRGTMEFCSQLFDYLIARIEKNKSENIYFELSETSYLDSSFIGVIVSIEKKLQKESRGSIVILNPTEKVKEILSMMGLSEILPMKESTKIKNIELNEEIEKKLEKDYNDIKLLLESHQNLMEINPENKKRFGLVEEMLKQELERNKNE
ncbi:MAG: STAS domain-containing protein [Brevinematales bacterium]|nr:STAS domain-containing protein [Brevinematales bacterium]